MFGVHALLVNPVPASAPVFDVAGTVGTAGSCTIVPTAGTTVYAGVMVASSTHPLSTITYGGSGMTLVGSQANNNSSGITYVYKMVAVASGSATIAVTTSGGTQTVLSAVSYSGVVSESITTTSFGSSTSPSIGPASPPSGGTSLAVLGGNRNVTATSGGNQRVLANNSTTVGFAMLDAVASATFGATLGATAAWAGIVVGLV